ncbi:MAG: EamA family transporter [Chitinophagaceae bacterium]|nr:MAG: EamA family transporter [Chitinophagaceae bacterium]
MLSVAYLALCASVGAFLLWNEAIRRIGPARTSLFGNLIPVFSSLEAVALLGESISSPLLAAFACILSGLLLAQWPRSAPKASGINTEGAAAET